MSPVLIPSSTNLWVDHFHPVPYLSHLPPGIFYCMPIRKIMTQCIFCVELLCGSQPTAPTCVVWSWRLIDCFALTSAVRSFWDVGLRHSLTQRLCHTGGPHYGWNSCLWLPLPVWYGSAHAWGTSPAVGWCLGAPCFKFALFSMQLN